MAKKSTDTSSTPSESAAAILTGMQSAGMGSLAWLGTTWIERMSDVTAEWLDFVTDRIKEDVATQHQILHCKDVADLQKIQIAFFQRAVEQYQAETGKLVEMSSKLFEGTEDGVEFTPPKRHSTPV